jgi:protein gp37
LVFVDSMSDLFHAKIPVAFVERVWNVMARAPQHRFQILTKRPGRMASVLRRVCPDPLPNVWVGTSIENQDWARIRIPKLLETPAAVRFLSAEPLRGPIDLTRLQAANGAFIDALRGDVVSPDGIVYAACPGSLDWIIAGGESGPGHRPIDPAWVRSMRDQCTAAGVAFFFKLLCTNANRTSPLWLTIASQALALHSTPDRKHSKAKQHGHRDSHGDLEQVPPASQHRLRVTRQSNRRSSAIYQRNGERSVEWLGRPGWGGRSACGSTGCLTDRGMLEADGNHEHGEQSNGDQRGSHGSPGPQPVARRQPIYPQNGIFGRSGRSGAAMALAALPVDFGQLGMPAHFHLAVVEISSAGLVLVIFPALAQSPVYTSDLRWAGRLDFQPWAVQYQPALPPSSPAPRKGELTAAAPSPPRSAARQ